MRQALLKVLVIDDGAEQAGRIGELYADPRSRSFAEAVIDAEEDQATRAVLVAPCASLRGRQVRPSAG